MSVDRVCRATDRRRFLKLVGMAGLTSTLAGPAIALAQSRGEKAPKPASKPAKAKSKAAKSAPPSTDEPPKISDDARSLTDVIRRRYGAHLTEGQLERIAEELTWRLRGGEALRKSKLVNADEPDVTFFA